MKINTDNNTGLITFTFPGEKDAPVTDVPMALFDVNKVHFDLCIHAMMFGFTNRVKDTAAIKKDKDNHYTITEAMRREQVVEMIDHLEAGGTEWNIKGTGRKAPKNAAIQALATALGKTYEEAEVHIAEMAIAELSE